MDALGGRPKGKTVDWDIADEQAAPLDFKDWLKASERGSALERDKEARLAWAHYALRTTPDMSLGQIKSAYRKLAMRFHPDRNPGRGSAPFQAVSAAFETIEADLK
ncbi:MAG: J domain-containing protein [Elusimicrobia bacterium]|nr:J domain-containing protein [Elusimicrobiota bacterium]